MRVNICSRCPEAFLYGLVPERARKTREVLETARTKI